MLVDMTEVEEEPGLVKSDRMEEYRIVANVIGLATYPVTRTDPTVILVVVVELS